MTNVSSTYSTDKVRFKDVLTGEYSDAVINAEGTGTVTIGGKVYNLKYYANDDTTQDTWNVTLDYPDSSTTGSVVVYPTIQTVKGAKVAFYKPVPIRLNYTGTAGTTVVTQIKFPNGNGYTDVAVGAANGLTTLYGTLL